MAMRSLCLGAAAAGLIGAAALAAELPAAEPADYVRVCDAYGAGFFFIPGTESCLQVSGLVRTDAFVLSDNWFARTGQAGIAGDGGAFLAVASLAGPLFVWSAAPGLMVATFNSTSEVRAAIVTAADAAASVPPGTPAGSFIRSRSALNDQYGIGVRALLRFDARSRTEWGVLRSFLEFAANTNNSADSGSAIQIRYAFVQFGPVTAGITDSFFNGDNGPTFINHIANRQARPTLIAYTALIGGGVSATVSLEDPEQAGGVGGSTTVFSTGGSSAAIAGWQRQGIRLPDIVGNIRVREAWGSAQINGVIAQRDLRSPSCAFPFDPGDICDVSHTGWAVGGSLRINLPALGAGSNVLVKGSYGEGGGIAYIGNVPGFGYVAFADLTGAVPRIGHVGVNSAFGVYGVLQVFLSPALRTALIASHARMFREDNGALTGQVFVSIDRASALSGQIVWAPQRDLELGLEAFYVRNRYEAFNGLPPGPPTTARISDEGYGAIFRIQRSF